MREKQPSLTSQVLQFFKSFSEHCLVNAVTSADNPNTLSPKHTRHRNHSISSSGTAASNVVQSKLTHGLMNTQEDSIATKGFNLAVNVVTEILK